MSFACRSIRSLVLGAMMIVTGCSDPAGQEPISLRPGLYSLAMKGEVDPRFSEEFERNQSEKRKLCISAARATSFAEFPLKDTLEVGGECSSSKQLRVGNTFSGKRVCAGPQPPLTATISYTGQLAADNFTIDAHVDVKFDPEYQGMREISYQMKIEGKRIGDCQR